MADEDIEVPEGMPGTWSFCGETKRNHEPHRHTVYVNEGPYHNVLCLGFPGNPNGDAPEGRIVYDVNGYPERGDV